MPVIEISSLTHSGVDVFCTLTEAQLRQRMESGKGLFIEIGRAHLNSSHQI